jgi:hypothetical protein
MRSVLFCFFEYNSQWSDNSSKIMRQVVILVTGMRLTSHWTAAAFTGLLSVPG